MNKINRPLVVGAIYSVLGIIGGTLWTDGLQVPFCLLTLIIGLSIVGICIVKRWVYSIFGIVYLLGILQVISAPVIVEQAYFVNQEPIAIQGEISSSESYSYSTKLTLTDVQITINEHQVQLKSDIVVWSDTLFSKGDKIALNVEYAPTGEMMNPYDFDYGKYNKNNNIVAVCHQVGEVTVLQQKDPNEENLQQHIGNQLTAVYREKDKGIMQAILVGDTTKLDHEIRELYNQLGIGHLFALSGFHIGVIYAIISLVVSYMGANYTVRRLFAVIGIWGYCIMTGSSLSTVRASIMLSILLVGRCIWEEEDYPTLIALAVIVLVIMNPFVIYTVSFQLSIMAVSAVALTMMIKQDYDEILPQSKWLWATITTLVIGVMTGPILAYHFFFVPIIGSLLNIILIPVFAWLIPIGILTLILSYVAMPLAHMLAECTSWILNSIESVARLLIQVPGMSWCSGRPSLAIILLYYIVVIAIYIAIKNRKYSKRICYMINLIVIVLLMCSFRQNDILEIIQLYVGQGDGAILLTPTKQAIVMDTGPKGKGSTIKRHLNANGINTINAVIISHQDEDHIGGLEELLASNIKIEQVILPTQIQLTEELDVLLLMCKQKGVPVNLIEQGSRLSLGEIEMFCLSPVSQDIKDANEDSLVLHLKYKDFDVLFTGDIGRETEQMIDVSKVDVLKVAHHGSKNSSSERFILQTQPEYGMISCGKNNLYNHPHEETLQTLDKYGTNVLRTDVNGAIIVKTDGEYIEVKCQIQEE